MKLLLFLAIGFSITNAMSFLHVSSWLRKAVSGLTDLQFSIKAEQNELSGLRQAWLGRLVRCHACLGFWVGGFLSVLFQGFISEYMEVSFAGSVILDGFLLSGFNFVLWVVLRKLGAGEL
jgi:hypothetical protein